MRRADRLFQLVQALRGGTRTAAQLAERLAVSRRTVYRDVRDLADAGVPIRGEAGVGYALPDGYHLPPLAFTADETEALVLGARVVEEWGDPALAAAARSALEKAAGATPGPRRDDAEPPIFTVRFDPDEAVAGRLATLRGALRERRKVRFRYVRTDGARSERTAEPVCLVLMDTAWLLVGWCELRADFRTFRLDRMDGLRVEDAPFAPRADRDLRAFLRTLADDPRCGGAAGS